MMTDMGLIAPIVGMLMSPLGATLSQNVRTPHQQHMVDGKTR